MGDLRVDREASPGKYMAVQKTNCGNFKIGRVTSPGDCSAGRREHSGNFQVGRGTGVGGFRVNFYSARNKKRKISKIQ